MVLATKVTNGRAAPNAAFGWLCKLCQEKVVYLDTMLCHLEAHHGYQMVRINLLSGEVFGR
jgi:hypothetical protein